MNKVVHDSSSSLKGTIYQFYQTVDWCFELLEGQSLYIEKFGDITVSNEVNIEVKQYGFPLTDGHENLWRTIANWLNDSFDHRFYNRLVLLTTQEIGSNSSLIGWNDKSLDEKRSILESIYSLTQKRNAKNDNKPATLGLMDKVCCAENYVPLGEILNKFYIMDSSPTLEEEYNIIVQKYGKVVLAKKRKQFINSLLGYIVSSETIVDNNWVISYEDFASEVSHLVAQYASDTRIFPTKHLNHKANSEQSYEDKLYVKKILEINYSEVVLDAATDYYVAVNTINEEFAQGTLASRLNTYRNGVVQTFHTLHRRASRNCSGDVNKSSQDMYDECSLNSPTILSGFESTPTSFKNGVLHIEMDDASQTLKWKLDE